LIKKISKLLLALVALLILIVMFNLDTIKRLNKTNHLFDEDQIIQNFQNMDRFYASSNLQASANPYVLPQKENINILGKFAYENISYDINQYLKDTNTEGLLIIQNDTIVFENYWNDLQKDESHISWSMAKSFTSTLIGIYYEKGFFKLTDPITKYLPQYVGTGYDGVTIKNLLQMSSGVKFNEDYGDFNSDINRFGRAFALGSSLEDFSKSLTTEKAQGTYNHYVSIDTQVLGILLSKVTGKSITQLTQEHIWEPLGMEYDGQWLTDNTGMEVVLGGLNATLRDYSKLGLLYKNKGQVNGKRIVSPEWIKDATTPDADHLLPGNNPNSSNHHGYGYQWWLPRNNKNIIAMGGIYNQYVYTDTLNSIVITKLSANHHYKQEGHITKDIHFAMFDQIIENMIGEKEID